MKWQSLIRRFFAVDTVRIGKYQGFDDRVGCSGYQGFVDRQNIGILNAFKETVPCGPRFGGVGLCLANLNDPFPLFGSDGGAYYAGHIVVLSRNVRYRLLSVAANGDFVVVDVAATGRGMSRINGEEKGDVALKIKSNSGEAL